MKTIVPRTAKTNKKLPPKKCHCGSGVEYKYCHEPIDSAPPLGRVSASQNHYSKQWQHNQSELSKRSSYEWMASRLDGASSTLRILDIGTGGGAGVAALFNRFKPETLISIDENPDCSRAAQRFLAKSSIPSEMWRPIVPAMLGDGYINTKSNTPLGAPTGVILLGADLFSDSVFIEKWCREQSFLFDVITIWQIGSHFERLSSLEIQHLGIRDASMYRWHLQKQAIDLGCSVLARGGIINIIDRVEHVDRDKISDAYNFYRQQLLAGTGMTMNEAEFSQTYFSDSSNPNRVKVASLKNPSLASMILRKM